MRRDKMIFGEDVIVSTDCHKTGLNNNVLVCGSSGCGKTMSVIEPRLLETYNSNLIVTVTKRRIVEKYMSVFRERGYRVLDLNLIHPMKSNVIYDPLQYVKSYNDARFLAESIVMAESRKRITIADPYWDKAAMSLLTAEIGCIIKTNPKATFADVLNLNERLKITNEGFGNISKMETTLDREFEKFARSYPTHYANACWNTFHCVPIKTASCILSELNSAIDDMFSPELRRAMVNRRKINFKKFAEEKSVLFISSSAVNRTTHYFVNIFYGQMFKELFEYAQECPYGQLPIPIHVLCDDFATGGKILNFPEYISIFRETQMSVTMLIQSESQLQRMYSTADAITIINNCDTYIYMGGTDITTVRDISIKLNEPMDEILYMPLNREIIFRRGSKPIVTNRYNVLEDKRYQKITSDYEKKQKKVKHSVTSKNESVYIEKTGA